MKIWSALVKNMLNRSQRNFAHTPSWRVQNFVVISRVHFKLEHRNIWSHFEFDPNIVSGTGARSFMRRTHKSSVDSSHKRSVMQNFDVSFAVGLNKLLNKQSSWLEMPWCSSDMMIFSKGDILIKPWSMTEHDTPRHMEVEFLAADVH